MTFFLCSQIFEPIFSAAYSFLQPKKHLKCPFITKLVPGKVEKENHIRKVQKSEERKVKNIGKEIYHLPNIMLNKNSFLVQVNFSSGEKLASTPHCFPVCEIGM